MNKVVSIAIVAAAPYAIVFFAQIVFARYLTVDEIGQFALVNFLLLLFMTTTNWGADRYIIANKGIETRAINEVVTQEMLLSLAAYLLCLFFFKDYISSYANIEESDIFWLLLLFIFLYNPLSRSKAILEKEIKFLPAYLPALAAHVFGCNLGFVLLYMGFGIWSMIAWKTSVFVVEYIVLLIVTRNRPTISLQMKNVTDHAKFCLPFYLGGVISFFSVTADIWIVNNFLGSFELGLYWLAFSTSHVLLAVRTLISRMLLPFLSKETAPTDKILVFARLNGYLQIAVLLLTVFVTYWGADLFVFLYGSKWSEASLPFVVLFYAVAFKIVSGTANTLLHSFMKTEIDLHVAIANVFVLIPLLLIFTNLGGVIGATLAVLLSTLLMTIYVYEIHVKKVCGLGFIYFFSYLFVNVSILLVINFIVSHYPEDLIIRSCATALSLLVAYLTLNIPSIKRRNLDFGWIWSR